MYGNKFVKLTAGSTSFCLGLSKVLRAEQKQGKKNNLCNSHSSDGVFLIVIV